MVTTTSVSGEELLVRVRGALEGEPAARFQSELEKAVAGAHRTITLDLLDVPSINSSSIGRILLSRKTLSDQGRSIRIQGCSTALLSTFGLIRFDRLVSIRAQP